MDALLSYSTSALLSLGTPATPPGTQPNPTAQLLTQLGMFLFLGFIFYFLLIRPQRVRARQQESMLKSLKKGDKIVTGSGIIGIVVAVNDKSLSIRSADTKLEILKS